MNNFEKAIDEWLTREYMGVFECTTQTLEEGIENGQIVYQDQVDE